MSNAIRSFGRTTLLAVAALTPGMLLAGCGSSNAAQVDKQVAIAKEAADRAVAAQKAAERAAKLARAQSGSASFGEDEVIEEIDDSSDEEMSESSEEEDGGETIAEAGTVLSPPPR